MWVAPEAPGGASVLKVLDACMDAAQAREIDAICFAPLNKHAMKQGGLKHEDELHHFAERLGVTGYFCEFNTLGGLWTARVSSHVPLKDVPGYLDQARVIDAAAVGIGGLTQTVSWGLRAMVTGNAQYYGLIMAAGVLAALALAVFLQ